MSLRTVIHSVLLADAAVVALIGDGEACRHYPERAPQNPDDTYLVSNEVTGTAAQTHGSATDAEDTLDETTMQFTAIAGTVAAAIALRLAVRAALMNPANALLVAARIKVTSPEMRFTTADEIDRHGAQLDLTFFHNPQN